MREPWHRVEKVVNLRRNKMERKQLEATLKAAAAKAKVEEDQEEALAARFGPEVLENCIFCPQPVS